MAVANSDYVPDPFPGITAPAGTGAPGSQGDRTVPPDAGEPAGLSGLPGSGMIMPAALHGGGPGQGTSTSQPGQTAASVISPGPAADYTSPGPRPGRSVVEGGPNRYSWQQPAGG
jgi:hypothetical protein